MENTYCTKLAVSSEQTKIGLRPLFCSTPFSIVSHKQDEGVWHKNHSGADRHSQWSGWGLWSLHRPSCTITAPGAKEPTSVLVCVWGVHMCVVCMCKFVIYERKLFVFELWLLEVHFIFLSVTEAFGITWLVIQVMLTRTQWLKHSARRGCDYINTDTLTCPLSLLAEHWFVLTFFFLPRGCQC